MNAIDMADMTGGDVIKEVTMMDECNNSLVLQGHFQRLGPGQLYKSLGPSILLPLYCTLGLFVTFLWCYAIFWRRRVVADGVGGVLVTTLLQFFPVLNMTLTLPIFLSPPTTPLVSLIQVPMMPKKNSI